MSENTASAACTQAEWDSARDAGLPIATTADERAIHKFAELIRKAATPRFQPPPVKEFMRLVNRYAEACDDMGTNLFNQTATETAAKALVAANVHEQIEKAIAARDAVIADLLSACQSAISHMEWSLTAEDPRCIAMRAAIEKAAS